MDDFANDDDEYRSPFSCWTLSIMAFMLFVEVSIVVWYFANHQFPKAN